MEDVAEKALMTNELKRVLKNNEDVTTMEELRDFNSKLYDDIDEAYRIEAQIILGEWKEDINDVIEDYLKHLDDISDKFT